MVKVPKRSFKKLASRFHRYALNPGLGDRSVILLIWSNSFRVPFSKEHIF